MSESWAHYYITFSSLYYQLIIIYVQNAKAAIKPNIAIAGTTALRFSTCQHAARHGHAPEPQAPTPVAPVLPLLDAS
jgi:hypothetical protein